MDRLSFYIRTPASTDRYSLTSDLVILATDVEAHLDNLQSSINLSIRENTSPTFTSIMTASPPIFPGITLSGTLVNSGIINNADGFGLKSGSLKLSTTTGSTWASNGPITVPDSGSGSQVINGNTLTSTLAPLISRIAALETTVTSLQSSKASTTYVDTQDNALSARITNAQAKADIVDSKANYWTQPGYNHDWAPAANYANSAGSAGSAEFSVHSRYLEGRHWNAGDFDAGTTAGGASGYHEMDHGLGVVPMVILAMAYNDTGACSIVCSIDYKTDTRFRVNWRNLNNNQAENAQINWLAVT